MKAEERRIEWMALGDVKQAPSNPKDHDIGEICVSIGRRGFVELPAIDERTGRLVAGHGRLEALQKMQADKAPLPGGLREEGGKWLMPVVRGWASKNDADAAAYLVASNRLTEVGGWNEEALRALMAEIALTAPEEIAGSGYDQQDIDKFINEMNSAVGDIASDDIPESAPAISKKGDVWQLGGHRLMCGSCTNAADVGRLMSGAVADMCFTSPPYALGDVHLRAGDMSPVYLEYVDSPENWPKMMREWFEVSRIAVVGPLVINLQMLSGNKMAMAEWLGLNSSRLKDVAVWDKGHAQPSMEPGVLNSQFEFLFIMGSGDDATRKIKQASWRGTQANVIQISAHSERFSEHGASMPIALAQWVIGQLCDLVKTVYEPFAGTGTTICAAESLGRTCYAMELTPRYVDICITRWEKMTGRKAVKL